MYKENTKDGYYWAKHKKSGNTIIVEKDFAGWWCCGSECELGIYEYTILGEVKPHEEKQFSINDIDLMYLTGVFNSVGLDGLLNEIQRLKGLNKKPHDLFSSSKFRVSTKEMNHMEKRIIGKWEAIIEYDEEEKLYIITFNGEGGAIVSDKDLPEAERKFIDGMLLSESVGKLLNFEDHGSFEQKSKNLIDELRSSFKQETGLNHECERDDFGGFYGDSYVEWLEQKVMKLLNS